MLLFTSLLNINTTKREKIIYVLLISLVGIVTRLLVPNPFNTFLI